MSLNNDQKIRLVKNALHHLDYALEDLIQARLQLQTRQLYLAFMRPKAVLFATFFLGVLATLLLKLNLTFSNAFSLALVIYIILISLYLRKLKLQPDRSFFLQNVDLSDTFIIQLGDPTLIPWPSLHPNDEAAQHLSEKKLREILKKRQEQLEVHLEKLLENYKKELLEKERHRAHSSHDKKTKAAPEEKMPSIPPKLLAYKSSPEYLENKFEIHSKADIREKRTRRKR